MDKEYSTEVKECYSVIDAFLAKAKQFKNLILLTTGIIIFLTVLYSDPLGYFVARAKYKSQIMNEIAIARAETEKRIALIKAETEAELLRLRAGSAK